MLSVFLYAAISLFIMSSLYSFGGKTEDKNGRRMTLITGTLFLAGYFLDKVL